MYVCYHMHTMLSNGTTDIDSVTDFHEYVDAAKKCGMPALGFSEHGNIFSWLKKKEAVEEAGMKYIHGIEVYLTEDNENSFDEESNTYNKTRDNYHCVLIAKNLDGVHELNELISKSYNRDDYHFYYRPRISLDELFATSDNIIITTACLAGVLNNGSVSAKERYLNFLINNKHRCYLEIQHHNYDEQIRYNNILYSLSEKYGIPLIVGTDTHALNDKEMEARAVEQKAKSVHFFNEDKLDMTFKTPDELIEAYKLQGAPMELVYEAMNNTLKLADSIEEFPIDRSYKYPSLYKDPERVFKDKINKGYITRGIYKKPNSQEYIDRIHSEFETYKHNGAIDFMLLEEDYKSKMREMGIRYGYSRGSVSGSIIAYLLGITEIDSIKYNLNFSRFMNVERVSLADVDTDWYSDDREYVKQYLFNKKGLYCCDIVTFNTIQLKNAINDVCRALYKDKGGKYYLQLSNEINDLAERDEDKARKKYPDVFKYADMLNGVVISVGNHPAGCVVSPFPVTSAFGTFESKTDKYPISQLNMKEIDSLNFVKLDILSLDNVGLIYKTCDLVGLPYLTPDNTPPDDVNVWNSIKEDTTLIFQWESPSASMYLKKLFSDETIAKIKRQNPEFSYMDLLSIGNGALRPAGESYRDNLADGIYQSYGCKPLDDFMKPTLGYCVYQEQIIEFLHKFCGYTMGEADVVRRGFSKKLGTEKFIPKIKSGFIKTMKDDYGIEQSESEELIVNFIRVIEDASSYLFSRNHAYPYSWIGYICGYLRYYYPLEFLTTALNIFQNDQKKTLAIIDYAKRHNIKISPIKFRHSVAEYSCDKNLNEISKGIASIKFMNSKVANEIYALRDNRYDTFVDLLYDLKKKTSLDTRQLNILIKLDFFSEFGDANKLLKVNEIFSTFYDKKNVTKKKLESLDINKDVLNNIPCKETATMYTNVNMKQFIIEASKRVNYTEMTLKERIERQRGCLGYIDYEGEQYAGMAVVLSVNTKYSPKLELHSLKNNTTVECKIRKAVFNKCKLQEDDIIKIDAYNRKPKMKMCSDGNFEPIEGTSEIWVSKYHLVKNL